MITSTHDQLDTWVLGLTILTSVGGIGAGGWLALLNNEKKGLDKQIEEMRSAIKTQWVRIDENKERMTAKEAFDELRHKTEAIEKDYVSRGFHEEFRRELKEDVQAAISLALAPLKVSIDNLTNQMAVLSRK